MTNEKLLEQQQRLIKALLKLTRKNQLLEAQNSLYSMFLTPEQQNAADNYAYLLLKRDDKR